MSHPRPRPLDQLLKAHAPSSLTQQEKAKMKLQLSSFIEANPVKQRSFWAAHFFRIRPLLAGLTVVVLFSGVSVASAQTALPGDFLYDLKILVNEDLPKAFMSSEEKEDFAVEQLENRLKEAEELKSQGALDENKRAYLRAQMEEHLRVLENDEEDDTPLVERFSDVLKHHESILPDVEFGAWKGKSKFKFWNKDELEEKLEDGELNPLPAFNSETSLFTPRVPLEIEAETEEETTSDEEIRLDSEDEDSDSDSQNSFEESLDEVDVQIEAPIFEPVGDEVNSVDDVLGIDLPTSLLP